MDSERLGTQARRVTHQTSADATCIGGSYNGAFSYYFCKHFRETLDTLSRAEPGVAGLDILEASLGVKSGF